MSSGNGRRNYSDREKGEALALLDANGGNVQATAQALRIPDSTLGQWAQGQGVNSDAEAVRRRTSLELADKFEDVLVRILGGVTGKKIDEAGLKDLMIAAGIAAEKRNLMRGEPTAINETQAREAWAGLAERIHRQALAAGQDVTLEIVKARIVARRPEARAYLLPEDHRGEGVTRAEA